MYRAIAVAGATVFWLGLTGCAITRDGMFFELHASDDASRAHDVGAAGSGVELAGHQRLCYKAARDATGET